MGILDADDDRFIVPLLAEKLHANILIEQYTFALGELANRCSKIFDDAIPVPYTLKGDISRSEKCNEICKILGDENKKQDYISELNGFEDRMFPAFNEFYAAVCVLPGLTDPEKVGHLMDQEISRKDAKNTHFFIKLKENLEQGELDQEDVESLFRRDFKHFVGGAANEIVSQVCSTIEVFSDMAQFSHAEESLRGFCKKWNLTAPDAKSLPHACDIEDDSYINNLEPRFSLALLYSDDRTREKYEKTRAAMYEAVKKAEKSIVKASSKQLEFYINGSPQFNDYYDRHKKELMKLGSKRDILAILNDKNITSDEDWLFTVEGICFFGRGRFMNKILDDATAYSSIIRTTGAKFLEVGERKLKNNSLDMERFMIMIDELSEIYIHEYPNTGIASSDKDLTQWFTILFDSHGTGMLPPSVLPLESVLPNITN